MRGAGGDDVGGREDAQVSARDLQALERRNIEGIELDPAIEACAEGLDDAAFEDGERAPHHDLANGG